MEMVEKSIEETLAEKIADKLETLDTLKPGTDEHSKLTEDIVKLYKVRIENYKVECEIYNQSQKIENDKFKDEEELKIKKSQIENEEKRSRKPKVDTILMLATISGLTVGTCVFESKGYIFPAKLLQHVPKIKLFA